MIDSQDDVRSIQEQSLDYQPGAVVFEKFEIIERLGSGSVGKVYRARQIDLNRMVALKVLSSTIKDPRAVVRFQNEARATSKLGHKNIASVMDFGVSKEGEPYMAMEMIEGMTLQRLLTLEGQLTTSECLTIAFQISDALAHAHQKGIVHRDIKPGNIMIVTGPDEESIVKVLDFGVAKVLKKDDETEGYITDPGAIVGSPLYMSPEQCGSEKVTAQSDLYSLGCVLYQCLASKPPFANDNILELLMLHREAPPPELEISNQGPIEERLKDLVSKLLSKKPEDRPSSAEEVRSLLSNLDESMAQLQNEARARLKSAQEADPTAFPTEPSKQRLVFLITALGAGLILILAGSLINYLFIESKRAQPHVKENITKPDVVFGMSAPNLKEAFLGDESEISNSGLIYMDGPEVSDKDLEHFKSKQETTRVSLTGTRVTDRGIKNLVHLKLILLDLSDSQVKTLDSVGTICSIIDLNLTNTPIVDDSLKNLKSMSKLRTITLDGTKISPRGLLYLASLPDLATVSIERCPNLKASELQAVKVEMPLIHFNHSPNDYFEELQWIAGEQKHAEAVSQTEKGIAALERNFGKNSGKLIRPLGSLALYARVQKNFKLSEQATLRGLQIARSTGSAAYTIMAGDCRFHHYAGVGDIKNALKSAASQKAVRKSYGIVDQLREAEYLESIGCAYLYSGNFREALRYLKQCVAMRTAPVCDTDKDGKYYRENYGPHGIQTLVSQTRVGLVHIGMDQQKEAKKCLEQLEYFPPLREEHAPFAQIKSEGHLALASIYFREGKLKEALKQNQNAAVTCAPFSQLVALQIAARKQADDFSRAARKQQ